MAQLRLSRRHLLAAVGTVGIGTAVSDLGGARQDQLSRFEIRTASQARNLEYEFVTDGPVYAVTYPHDVAAEPGGNDAVEKRSDDTFHVTGVAGGGQSDTWLIDGDVRDFDTGASNSEYSLFLDGEEISTPSPSNRFEFRTAQRTSNLRYEFLTTGPVEAVTRPDAIAAEPNGNDAVTQRTNGEYHVTGVAGGGQSDTWQVDGDVIWFNTTATENEYTLLWEGEEISPPQTDRNWLEFRTASQARRLQYEFTTGGPVIPITLPDEIAAEPSGNDTVEQLDNGEFYVSGIAGGGQSDSWLVDGDLLDFTTSALEDEYTLLWNGNLRDGGGNGGRNVTVEPVRPQRQEVSVVPGTTVFFEFAVRNYPGDEFEERRFYDGNRDPSSLIDIFVLELNTANSRVFTADFDTEGTHRIRVDVRDADENQLGTVRWTVHVTEDGNVPPTAERVTPESEVITVPADDDEETEFTLRTTDPEGELDQVIWWAKECDDLMNRVSVSGQSATVSISSNTYGCPPMAYILDKEGAMTTFSGWDVRYDQQGSEDESDTTTTETTTTETTTITETTTTTETETATTTASTTTTTTEEPATTTTTETQTTATTTDTPTTTTTETTETTTSTTTTEEPEGEEETDIVASLIGRLLRI